MMKKKFKIVVLPGDGIGPEVMEQALRICSVLERHLGADLEIETRDFGGISIDNHGNSLTDATLDACKQADAILLGAVGGPKWDGGKICPEQGLLKLRKDLNFWANIRPCVIASDSACAEIGPLKPEISAGTNIIMLRELTGGLYFGDHKEDTGDGVAIDSMPYSRAEIERVAHMSAFLAKQQTNKSLRRVCVVDKANVLASSRLWRKVFKEIFERDYPDIPLTFQLVDSAAMILVKSPAQLNGIVATENLFGDILSDEASIIPGSLGLSPSASLSQIPKDDEKTTGLYEPIHGSAPDIAGKGIANPIGAILSTAMMARYTLKSPKLADAIEEAVKAAIDSKEKGGLGLRSKDMQGSASTSDIGDAIVNKLEDILSKKQKSS